jgi:ribosomal protein L27
MSLKKLSTAKLEAMLLVEQDENRKDEIRSLIQERKAKKSGNAEEASEEASEEAPEQTATEAVVTEVANEVAPEAAATNLLGDDSDGNDVLAAALAAAGDAGSYTEPSKQTPKAAKAPKEKKTKEISNGAIVSFTKFRTGEEITGPIIREIIGTEGLPYVGVRWSKDNGGDDKIYYKQKGVVKYADAAEQEKATAEVEKVKAELAASKPPKAEKPAKEKATPATPSNPAESVVIEIPEEA